MARGYLDFSPLFMGHTNDKTGQYYSEAIGNVSGQATNFINNQKTQKQQIYNEIESRKKLANNYTNETVKQSIQTYVNKINEENIELLKSNRFMLNPQDKAKIQQNFVRIDNFTTQLKGFEQASKKAVDEYMSPKGFGMYEDPSESFQNVLNSLAINPASGNIDENKTELALRDFQNTDSNIPGLNLKAISPDEFIYNFSKQFKETHKSQPLTPVVKTMNDPKLGLMQYSVTETPVDWGGFDREAVNALSSDDEGRQTFKFVQQNLTPEEQKLASAKYGIKDQFGRLSENPLYPMMMYYMKDKMGIDKIKTNIIDPTNPTRVVFPETKTEETGIDTNNPIQLNLGGYDILEGYTNPYAKKHPYTFKNSRLINKNELGDKEDISKEVADYTISAYDKASDGLVMVSDKTRKNKITRKAERYQEYRFVPREGNEKAVKDYLGDKYDEIINKQSNIKSDAYYNKYANNIASYLTTKKDINYNDLIQSLIDSGELNEYDKKIIYDRIMKIGTGKMKEVVSKIKK